MSPTDKGVLNQIPAGDGRESSREQVVPADGAQFLTEFSLGGAGRSTSPHSEIQRFGGRATSLTHQKKKKKKKWRGVEAGAMCKWNLHRGGDVEAMRMRWYGGGSEEGLSGARRAEVGLHYRSESSSEWKMIQTWGNTGYKSGNIRKSP